MNGQCIKCGNYEWDKIVDGTTVKCPKCGGEVIIRKSKKGRRFYNCENSPECDFISWQRPSTEKVDKQ